MSAYSQPIKVGAWKVDPRLLETRKVARCRLGECRAACCGHGVYVDLANVSRIREEADLVKPHLPPTRRDVSHWFDDEVNADSDFPSGYKVGTQVIPDPHHVAGSRCVFLRPDNRCALQVATIAVGRHPWALKPYYCALFPLVTEGDTLVLDDENEIYMVGGTCQRADAAPAPLYEIFKDELVLALGPEGYDQLCSIASARAGVDR